MQSLVLRENDPSALMDAMVTVLLASERGTPLEKLRSIYGRADNLSMCECEDSSHGTAFSGHHEYQGAYAQWSVEGGWLLCGHCYASGHCLLD